MSDTPNDKLAANSQAPKSMGGGANHLFEATPSLYLNEPEGIQANREQMGYTNLKEGLTGYWEWQDNKLVEVPQANREQKGYPLSELIVEEGGTLVIDTGMPELVTTGDIVAYYDGQGNIVVESPQASKEQEELRLLREYYQNDRAYLDLKEWHWEKGKELIARQDELAQQVEALQSPSHSGEVELPEAGGRLERETLARYINGEYDK